MAQYRPVYMMIWKDPHFQKLNVSGKLLFFFLFTNQSMTESGVYPLTFKTISNETGISKGNVEKLLDSMHNVSYDRDNELVFVHNALGYKGGGRRPDLQKVSIENDFRRTWQSPLWNTFAALYPYYKKTLVSLGKALAKGCKNVPLSRSRRRYKVEGGIKENVEDSAEFRLASLLFQKILERKPDYKEPSLQSWAKDIDLMLRMDKRIPETIEKVMLWCQADDFWQNNILSTAKLRKQFDRLELEMRKPKKARATGETDITIPDVPVSSRKTDISQAENRRRAEKLLEDLAKGKGMPKEGK